MRALAPPPTLPQNWASMAGQALFSQLGCAGCHTPSLTTASNPASFIPPSKGGTPMRSKVNKALTKQTFHPDSDFLLYSMGSLGDGITSGSAGPMMMRTPPLGASAPNRSSCTTVVPTIYRPQFRCTTAKAKLRRKPFKRYRPRSKRTW